MQCQAQDALLVQDWEIVDFYRSVSEQVLNLTPFGTKDGSVWIVPRYEGWVAGLLIMEVPQALWKTIVADAEFIHNLIRGRANLGSYFDMTEADFYGPDEEAPGG